MADRLRPCADSWGIYLHFKLQETENDDHTRGSGSQPEDGRGQETLDRGDLGPERRLYLRELIARYGYLLALNWNLGEENTQTPEQQRAMAAFIRNIDPSATTSSSTPSRTSRSASTRPCSGTSRC